MKFEEVKELSSKYLFQNYGRIDLEQIFRAELFYFFEFHSITS